MDALLAYFLGILTVLVIFLPFWVLSMYFPEVASVYDNVFCDQTVS